MGFGGSSGGAAASNVTLLPMLSVGVKGMLTAAPLGLEGRFSAEGNGSAALHIPCAGKGPGGACTPMLYRGLRAALLNNPSTTLNVSHCGPCGSSAAEAVTQPLPFLLLYTGPASRSLWPVEVALPLPAPPPTGCVQQHRTCMYPAPPLLREQR